MMLVFWGCKFYIVTLDDVAMAMVYMPIEKNEFEMIKYRVLEVVYAKGDFIRFKAYRVWWNDYVR